MRKTKDEDPNPKLANAVVQFAAALESMLSKRAASGGEPDDDGLAGSRVRPGGPKDPLTGSAAATEPRELDDHSAS
jgi:hypothetical protein